MPIFNLYPIENLNEKPLPTCIKIGEDIPAVKLVKLVEKKIDEVFSNMKKRKSNTNFQIDYPWLTI
jgi:hypothetical protein